MAWEILKALKLRQRGPVLIACPTCGRLQFDMDSVVAEVERRLEAYDDPIEVSVLGCAVNGIGEARHADFGITGAKDMGMIYSRGEPIKKVPTERLVDELFAEIDKYYAAGKRVVRDEGEAASIRGQTRLYKQLDHLRLQVPDDSGLDMIEPFLGMLITVSAFDLGQDRLPNFAAYRFLYERLIGAASRPWLPSAFCAAAALPHLHQDRRRVLLQSISESAATAPGWSSREPVFWPEWVEKVDLKAAA